MSRITNIHHAYAWNISRIAKVFGFDRATVRKRLKAAGVLPVTEEGMVPIYALRDVGPALFRATAQTPAPEIDVEQLLPRERRDWYQSENERLKLGREERHLVPDDESRREMAVLARAIAHGLDRLPALLERDCELSPEAMERVRSKLAALRDGLNLEGDT